MGLFSKLFGKKDGKLEGVQQNTRKTDLISSPKVKLDVQTERIEPEIPAFQGEYAKTIFLFANNKPSAIKGIDGYQKYLLYECGIKNPVEYHKQLIEEGYFELTSSVDFLNGLKVAEIKEILSQYGLPMTGKKESLIECIIKNIADDELKKFFSETLYSLSKKGAEFLENNNDYVKIHQHKSWGIGWQEYDANKSDGLSFYDIVWGILNKRLLSSNNFGRNEYLCMYQLLNEEGKKKRALEMLLRVIYIDFSGVELLKYLEFYKSGLYSLETIKEHFDVVIMIAPGLINAVTEYSDVYEDEMIESIYQWSLPVQVCSRELFYEIIHSIIQGTYDEEQTEMKLKCAYDKVVDRIIRR